MREVAKATAAAQVGEQAGDTEEAQKKREDDKWTPSEEERFFSGLKATGNDFQRITARVSSKTLVQVCAALSARPCHRMPLGRLAGCAHALAVGCWLACVDGACTSESSRLDTGDSVHSCCCSTVRAKVVYHNPTGADAAHCCFRCRCDATTTVC